MQSMHAPCCLATALSTVRGNDQGGLALQAMRLKHGMKFRMTAVALKMAGHKKVANMIISSWKVCHCSVQGSVLAKRHFLTPSQGSALSALQSLSYCYLFSTRTLGCPGTHHECLTSCLRKILSWCC